MNRSVAYFFAPLAFLFFTTKADIPEQPIGVIVTARNTSEYCIQNIASIFDQDYKNFRVIFIDDCSQDDMFGKVKTYVENRGVTDQITMISREENKGKLFNIYNAYHSFDDNVILCQIDGDDSLDNNNVFKRINEDFHKHDIWVRYGSCRDLVNGKHGATWPPSNVVEGNNYRIHRWLYNPPRVFYAWLFKQIKMEDLMVDSVSGHRGKFYLSANDAAMIMPMLEMSHRRIFFNPHVDYFINLGTPKILPQEQLMKFNLACLADIKRKPKYNPLSAPVVSPQNEAKHAKADCFILSFNQQKTKSLIASLKQKCHNIGTIIVQSQDNNQTYDSDVVCLDPSVPNQLVELLNKSSHQYILLAKDDYVIQNEFDINTYIQRLEQAFAYSCHLALSHDASIAPTQLSKDIPTQEATEDTYVWKFGLSFGRWQAYHSFNMNLYRKKDIIPLVHNTFDHPIRQLEQRLRNNNPRAGAVGLYPTRKLISHQ